MNTAVLFLGFNRPEVSEIVFDSIRHAKPPRLYVACDGAREGVMGEKELCESVRKIATNVDWNCELKTLFHEGNMGCGRAVSNAIDWFFDHEEEGIILEDDCLPDQSFFPYCEELLERYRDNSEVMVISGDFFHGEYYEPEFSYYFSRYNHCWGWASWKSSWRLFDMKMARWPELKATDWLSRIGDGHSDFVRYWTRIFDLTYDKKIDTWDYQWMFCCWANQGVTALPSKNLVKNIGFGSDATHTNNNNRYNHMQRESISFPLAHPHTVIRNKAADRMTDLQVVGTKVSVYDRIKRKIRNVLH